MGTREYIGKKIKAAREERVWSVRELGRQFGVSHATISRWESGDQPIEFPDIERLAQLLEKPVQFFLPEWYIDPRGLSPDLAQLFHRINDLPHGKTRDQLIENMMRAIEMVRTAMGAEEERP